MPPPHLFPSQAIRAAFRDYKGGMSVIEVAEKHGMSQTTVHRRFTEMFPDEYREISAKNRKAGERRGGLSSYSLGHMRQGNHQPSKQGA